MSFLTDITLSADARSTGVYVDGYPKNVDNDQGNLRAGGTISESNRFSSSSLGEGNPIDTISSGVNNQAINAGGTFNNQPSQVIVKATTTIAGLSNDVAVFGDSNSANGDSIKQLGVVRIVAYKQAIVRNGWNEYSGEWEAGYPVVATSGGWNISYGIDNAATLKASGTDVAANPSSAVPGKLTYLAGNVIPENDNYSAKTNW
jgi:hypothetical protein